MAGRDRRGSQPDATRAARTLVSSRSGMSGAAATIVSAAIAK